MEIIGAPDILTSSSQLHHYFGRPKINDTTSIQPIIAYPHGTQNIIFECCGRIGYESDLCII